MSEREPLADHATVARVPEETPTLVVGAAAAGPQTLQLTPGTVLGDRYRIVSLIGRGGMGVVYRADDLTLGQTIAVKFVSRRGADERRLYEEVRIGREVSHPNVVRLYDIAEMDGHLFITMEFVGGEDLASLLKRIGRLSSDKALAVARDICAGLSAAHEKGVIHRDLKPGNVLIDGRGRARITDFGLAVAEESAPLHVSAGTPAYMAPEQLAGDAASQRSDIYALGLVLYEIFTGRRTFEAGSTQELLRRQAAADFVRPTQLVRDVDPAVERLIVRALDPEPERRPASVEEMLSAMPGRDALSAAVAAGETPSPAMVAAATERGDLPIGTAAALLIGVIGTLIVYGALTSRSMLYNRLPQLKSPEVLIEKARDVIAAAGETPPRADSIGIFYTNVDERLYRQKRGDTSIEPTALLFLYRQSPRPMRPRNMTGRVLRDDPPLNVSGMVDVTLDSSGRLVEFVRVPDQLRNEAGASPSATWSQLFAHAGFVPPRPVPPKWTAPVDSDQKAAWLSGETRVEAASMSGTPVWFSVIRPWTRAARMVPPPSTAITRAVGAFLIFLLVVIPVVIILLAIRNLRRGRIDRRGAFRFAAVIFITLFAALALRSHHVPDLVGEWLLLSRVTMDATFAAVLSWLAYVAVEPLVRRRWPRMLIGWSRLLEGRFNDPIIGRDLLIGVGVGLLIALVWQLTALAPGASPLQMTTSPLSGVRHVGHFILFGLAEALLRTIGFLPFLLALHAVFRSLPVSYAVAVLAVAASLMDDATGGVAARATYSVIGAAAVVMVLHRFGVLAMATCAYTFLLLRNLPVTLDPSAWYFGRSILALTLVAVIATYGFFVSLGGKRLSFDFGID